MKISVVIPAYEDQAYLDRTVATLTEQTLQPHEIIVVDDGSKTPLSVPDGVILHRIKRASGYRGSSTAKNRGAGLATGDWLAFSDDDILHVPDALESVAKKLDEIGRQDVLVNVFSVFSGTSMRRDKMDEVLADRLAFSEQHLGIIDRDFFFAVGGYDADSFRGWGYNNQDLSLRVVRSGGLVTSNVRRISTGDLLYSIHDRASIHSSKKAKDEFLAKHGEPFDSNMLVGGHIAAS